jgi:hypothetical protein
MKVELTVAKSVDEREKIGVEPLAALLVDNSVGWTVAKKVVRSV